MDYQTKENSRSNAATSERECGAMNGAESLPCNHEQYKPKTRKQQAKTISQFLKQGKKNAMSSKDLMRLVGSGTLRELRMQIAIERELGALIISDTRGGYYLPADGEEGREELSRYVASMTSRAAHIFKATEGAKAALAILDGQEQIKEAAQHEEA